MRSACSGVKSRTASRTRSTPSTYAAGRISCSSSRTWSIASSTTASVPGRTKTCSSATRAVSVRRGSTTTIRPPRALRSRSRCGKSGTVISEPLDAIGLAPKTRKYDVRSMSLIGIISWWPNSSEATNWWGIWSTELALNRLRVRSDFTIATPWVGEAERVGVGVAEVDADRVAAVPVDGAGDAVGDQVERLVPADLVPLAGGPVTAYGTTQPVGVVVEVADRDALGADVATGERVVRVAADAGHAPVVDGELEAADRLADVADTQPGLRHVPHRRTGGRSPVGVRSRVGRRPIPGTRG